MSRLGIGARPLVTIDGYQFVDDALWQILTHGSVCYSTADPFVTMRYLPKPAPDRSNGYNPPNNTDTSNTVPAFPIGDYLPDICWIFTRLKPGYCGYGQTEDYFGPLFVQGGKFLSLKFEMVSGMPTIRGYHSVSGGFSIGSDFLPGALAVVAIMATAGAIGTALGAPPTLPGAGAGVGASGVVTVGSDGALLVRPVEPLLVGPVEPLLVGPLEPLVSTSPGWTLAETVAATKAAGTTVLEGAKVVNQVAGAIGAGAAVVAAIKGPQEQPTQSPAEKIRTTFSDFTDQLASVKKNVWYAVGGIAVLLAMG